MAKTFLNAEWRKLAMVNYAVDPSLLQPYLPRYTELDLWHDNCYVSLVGFMFQNTKVAGIKVPFHINFEEVNLRFYVRHKQQGIWKRGVVFIKEIVPRPALTFVANTLYHEKYVTMTMGHDWELREGKWCVRYAWGTGLQHSLEVQTTSQTFAIAKNSEEEFITEHYWGYSRISASKTAEYEVEHPRWEIYKTIDYTIDVDFGQLYGPSFRHLDNEKPVSVFLAEGSVVQVKKRKIL